jgi:hypothetical protein
MAVTCLTAAIRDLTALGGDAVEEDAPAAGPPAAISATLRACLLKRGSAYERLGKWILASSDFEQGQA